MIKESIFEGNSVKSNLGIVPLLDSKELSETKIDSATDLYEELDSRNIRVKRFVRDDSGRVVSKVCGDLLSDSLVRCSSSMMNFRCNTLKDGCGFTKHEFYRCNNRLCPRCSDVIGTRFTRKYRSFIEGMSSRRFLTLTLKNVESIDRDYFSQLSRYWSAFKKHLFRDKYVLNKGLYVKEVTEKVCVKTVSHTYNLTFGFYTDDSIVLKKYVKGLSRSKLVFVPFVDVLSIVHVDYHVHLHAIYEGSYLPQEYISAKWSKVTKGSMVVDIRPVRDKFKDMGYLLKYAGKTPNFSSVKSRVDYYLAVKGVRLVQTFGRFKDRCVLKSSPMVCPVCGGVHWVVVADDCVEEFNVLPHSSEFLDIVIANKGVCANRFFIELRIGESNVDKLLFEGLIFESKPDYLEVVQ